MKRKEQELLERAEGNESWEEEPADQQADGLEDEFDREFWIKVSNFYGFYNIHEKITRFWLAESSAVPVQIFEANDIT